MTGSEAASRARKFKLTHYPPFADQHIIDPQSWNLYAYVRNNPLKNTDPTGRDCFQGAVSCANYVIGGAGAVTNALTSGIVNLPNGAFDGFAMLFTRGQRVSAI